MKTLLKCFGRILLFVLILCALYLLTLCYPQPFFKYKEHLGTVTIYSDEVIPKTEIAEIVKSAQVRVRKSILYQVDTQQNVFIANNPIRWAYFSNINHEASGLNYVVLTHPIFFRKVDIINNRLYGNSGKVAGGDRTFDYFVAHEMTHYLEYRSMNWYKYPLKTNWALEGYCDYVAHDTEGYETALNHYLNVPENSGEKYYTRARTMVAYLLEKEKIDISTLWLKVDDYDSVIKLAIPGDQPNIVD